MKKLRCCPVCYENVYLEAEGTRQTGGKLEINYKIICPFCKLGFYKTGSVVMSYDEEAMQPEVKDSKHLFVCLELDEFSQLFQSMWNP